MKLLKNGQQHYNHEPKEKLMATSQGQLKQQNNYFPARGKTNTSRLATGGEKEKKDEF